MSLINLYYSKKSMPDTRSDRTRLSSRESNESRLVLIPPKLTSKLCKAFRIGSFEDAVRRPINLPLLLQGFFFYMRHIAYCATFLD